MDLQKASEDMRSDQSKLDREKKVSALIALAEQQSTIPFSVLSKALEIADPGKLEEFLIDAIQSGVVKGKIDEPRKEFTVTSFKYRTFGRPQIEMLHKRVSSLIDNLKGQPLLDWDMH